MRKAHGRLIILCGIPGSGKTTIGRALGARLGKCVHIETDAIRAMLGKVEHSEGESKFVYDAATAVAEEALRHKYDAVMIATFSREEFRREALSRLSKLFERWLVVWVWCDPSLAYQRNSERNENVTLETFMRRWRGFEPPRGALVIDSRAMAPDQAAARILAAIGEDEG